MNAIMIRTLEEQDRDWLKKYLTGTWGSEYVVSRGILHTAWKLPGFIAVVDNKPAGVTTYNIEGNQCEIVTLNSLIENRGVGRACIGAVKEKAREQGCKRLWLITTNDNILAFRYYQRRGFTIAGIHCNALEHSRRLKPQIPELGYDDIPLRDEIEFEMML